MHSRSHHAVAWPLAALAMLAALLAPALWNGFPLIFPDTGGYLERPFAGTLTQGRSAFYGAFLALGIPFEFWPNVLVQAALAVWLVVLTLRTHGLGGRPWLALGVMLLLAIGSGLPWFAGQLMPDIFAPLAVVSLHLLAFRNALLGRYQRIGLVAVMAAAIASHMAILALCLGLVIALLLMRWMARPPMPRPQWRLPAGAVAAGVALALASNFAIAGKFAFTPGGESFLFGRLIQDGIVARYLAERCPDPALRLCPYAGKLPTTADNWLWEYDTPFYKLGGWQDYAEEERRIIAATLVRYPGAHLIAAAASALEQLVRFKTDVTVNPWHNLPTAGSFEQLVPQVLPHFRAARQQARPFDLEPLNILHIPLAALAIVGLAGAVVFARRLRVAPPATALALLVLTALVANAAICGVFSNPTNRYQSRLVPLAPLALVVVVLTRRRPDRLGPDTLLA